MGKVAIVTDSNSGITQAEGKKMGIYVLPMPFYINEELFYEDITLTQEEFYEKLAGDADIKTSQPAPGDVMDMWDKALEECSVEEICQITELSASNVKVKLFRGRKRFYEVLQDKMKLETADLL